MRYIRFKAKSVVDDNWIIGYYTRNPKGHYIHTFDGMTRRIDPDTLCQCLGYKVSDTKHLWENDIVSTTSGMRGHIVYTVDKFMLSLDNGGLEDIPFGGIDVLGNLFD